MEEHDIGEDLELLCYHALQSMDLCVYTVPDSGRDADERSGLTAGTIDNRDDLLICHSEFVCRTRGGGSGEGGRRQVGGREVASDATVQIW